MSRDNNLFITKNRDIKNINEFNEACKLLSPKILAVLKFGESDLRFTLSEALTLQEDVDVNTLLSDFADSDPETQVLKIYSLAKEEARHKHFHNIDYKKELTVSLIPKRTITQGEVTRVEWYASLDETMNPQNLILVVNIEYSRNSTGFATSRITTRSWINEDETENPDFKITQKYYFVNPSDMIVEGLKRRKLLVNNIQIPTLTFMTEALVPLGYNQEAVVLIGRHFMDDYETDFSKFIENSSSITDPADEDFGKKSVIVELESNDPDGRNKDYNLWLDKAPPSLGGLVTIRQYLIGEFSI